VRTCNGSDDEVVGKIIACNDASGHIVKSHAVLYTDRRFVRYLNSVNGR